MFSNKSNQKGKLGEALIDEHFYKIGMISYQPPKDESHPFDRCYVHKEKTNIYFAEIKSKAHRNKYPDTGFDLRHYKKYKAYSEKFNIRMCVFFVDEMNKKIYGNYLDILERKRIVNWNGSKIEYPWISQSGNGVEIIYFPIKAMKVICTINYTDMRQLRNLNERNYDYLDGE